MEGAAAEGADPAAVTVFFGANDATLPDRCQGHQHVPVEEYQDNLRAICAYFKKQWPSTAIILITPPPIHEPARIRREITSLPLNELRQSELLMAVKKFTELPWVHYCIHGGSRSYAHFHTLQREIYGDDDPSRLPERTNEAAGTYAQACLDVAKELGHPAIDIWTEMQQFPDWQTSALSDGLHFSPLGNKILFDKVLKTIESTDFHQHSLPSDLPLFHEIDPNDPLKALEI